MKTVLYYTIVACPTEFLQRNVTANKMRSLLSSHTRFAYYDVRNYKESNQPEFYQIEITSIIFRIIINTFFFFFTSLLLNSHEVGNIHIIVPTYINKSILKFFGCLFVPTYPKTGWILMGLSLRNS